MSTKQVIKNKIEFNSIFQNSEQLFTKYFIFKYRKNDSQFRYGISVPKKSFKLAVQRNKVKRQIRSIINSITIENCVDIVIVIKKRYEIDNFQEVKKDLLNGLKKIK